MTLDHVTTRPVLTDLGIRLRIFYLTHMRNCNTFKDLLSLVKTVKLWKIQK